MTGASPLKCIKKICLSDANCQVDKKSPPESEVCETGKGTAAGMDTCLVSGSFDLAQLLASAPLKSKIIFVWISVKHNLLNFREPGRVKKSLWVAPAGQLVMQQ